MRPKPCLRYLLALTLLSTNVAAANSVERKIGSTPAQFIVPAGQCEVSDETTFGKLMNNKAREVAAAGDSALLLFHANCDELAALKSGIPNPLLDYGQYVFPGLSKDPKLEQTYSPDFIAVVCKASRSIMQTESVSAMMKDLSADLDKVVPRLKVSEPKGLGVIFEEPGVCYTGMIARLTRDKYDLVAVGVFSMLVLKGKFITYQAYGPYRSAESVTELLEKQKKNIAALIAANP
jgi:hypothetical protein